MGDIPIPEPEEVVVEDQFAEKSNVFERPEVKSEMYYNLYLKNPEGVLERIGVAVTKDEEHFEASVDKAIPASLLSEYKIRKVDGNPSYCELYRGPFEYVPWHGSPEQLKEKAEELMQISHKFLQGFIYLQEACKEAAQCCVDMANQIENHSKENSNGNE